MKKIGLLTISFLLCVQSVFCQTPVNMAAQPGYTYTENFADINNWIFNTNGTFSAGTGSQCFRGIDIATTTPAIPNGARVTQLSNFWQTPTGSGIPIYGTGIYKTNQSISMLSTGATDNSSSIAFDMYLNFASVNAGTLNFDWQVVSNNTGNRAGSLRVYATTDGITFTEITTAAILNMPNGTTVSGSINNAALPASFDGSSTARLRFYYHNGVGGNAGSRPRFSIDNIKVNALPTTPCTTPTAQPTNLTFTNVLFNQISLSYTAANPAPQNYLIVMSKNPSLSSNPVNNITYSIGDNLGDGTVVAITSNTTATITGLTNSTKYYFFIFSMNNVCTGGPLYVSSNPLTNNTTTLAGPLNCVAPTAQATNLIFTSVSTTSIAASFTASTSAYEYVILRTTAPSFTGTLNNGTVYNGGNVVGNGMVVTRTQGTSFTANNLASGTTYYFWVFALNSQVCNNGPVYLTTNPLNGTTATVSLPACATPAAQPSQLNLVSHNTFINGYFIGSASADGYLVLRSTNSTISTMPVNGTNYTVGSTLGSATVVANTGGTSFIDYNLMQGTTYYYFIFAKNAGCVGTSPQYLTTNPLNGNAATITVASENFYFGNLHAHSSYSDGNKDSATSIPANDFAYAKTSLCMDFLGISEHNHSLAGMKLSNYALGYSQAAAATTNNFLALYGMEYGVISNGGHVLVYGSDKLIGWENGNYNIYVPISDYTGTPETTGTTGLFRTVNKLNNAGATAFTSLAHPDYTDYNNLLSNPYNPVADSAIAGCAVSSGPAFSTSTSYNDPPSSFAYYDYYVKLLAKGYHIGPFMDHDTHYTNFGRSSNNRLAVVAPNLTGSDFFAAIKNRNFYATEDCDTRVYFTLNNLPMGSVTTGSNPAAISVYAYDPTSPSSVPTIKIMQGIVGSGIAPTQVASANSHTLSFTDNAIAANINAYYFADISITGNRTMTSPIWYTKTPLLPVKLNYFTAKLNSNRTVALQWQTSIEINADKYVIEKSVDGINFKQWQAVSAKGFGSDYNYTDEQPNEGLNFYRLKQVDKDGKFVYSNISSVNLKSSNINSFSLLRNPVGDILQLNINSKKSTTAKIIITDITGRNIQVQNINLLQGYQTSNADVRHLTQGTYLVSIVLNDEVLTEKFIKY